MVFWNENVRSLVSSFFCLILDYYLLTERDNEYVLRVTGTTAWTIFNRIATLTQRAESDNPLEAVVTLSLDARRSLHTRIDDKKAVPFATTIHLTASGLTKLSRVQRVQSLFRGLGGGAKLRLPTK